jgi:translation initiation factor eIF-2B subunit delta
MIDETVEEIRAMRTHSSSTVAVKAARALRTLQAREYATVEAYLRALERNGDALRRANPSHASLQNAVREVVETVGDLDPDDVEAAKRRTDDAVERVVETIQAAKRAAAENAAGLVDDGATLLTHDYSTTVLETVDAALDRGCEFEVYVTEARPRYLGRKSARALAERDGVETHLVVDSAAGYYLDRCDEVVVGMDCVVDGQLYNRVGTFPIAATAARLDVPVTVVGAAAKVVETDFVFENEFRAESEVMREPAEGFGVGNPSYDATPTALVDRVITEEGVHEF